jgi:multiple sugar transport system substrate-binding protein
MVSFLSTCVVAQKDSPIILKAILSDDGRWEGIIDAAESEFEKRHPGSDIQVQYEILPYEDIGSRITELISNKSSVDLISVDQIWLGELTEKGILTKLDNFTGDWGRSSEWYETNWDGGVYNNSVYGIWAWTDIRGIWYWKDLLDQANVDPQSLKTWGGYINASKQLNDVLRPNGIEGVHLVGASHSPDMWYPYLWMLGGDILEMRDGHPTRGSYWFPVFNSTEGVKALGFLKNQTEAGIKPQTEHYWGQEFVDRKFAVMIEGSWMPGEFPKEQWSNFRQKIGFIPGFPVPHENNLTSTLMGGWELAIPVTAGNKTLAWELLSLMVEPKVLTPMLQENGYLPTELPIGEGAYAGRMNQSIPYYQDMVSLIPLGHKRPNIPEYQFIADQIMEAINSVYHGDKQPAQALNEAAVNSARELGW